MKKKKTKRGRPLGSKNKIKVSDKIGHLIESLITIYQKLQERGL